MNSFRVNSPFISSEQILFLVNLFNIANDSQENPDHNARGYLPIAPALDGFLRLQPPAFRIFHILMDIQQSCPPSDLLLDIHDSRCGLSIHPLPYKNIRLEARLHSLPRILDPVQILLPVHQDKLLAEPDNQNHVAFVDSYQKKGREGASEFQ